MTPVLLIDDHAIVRAGIRRLLASRAALVLHEAATADEAAAFLARDRADLIVLDLNLPGLGGLEALKRLRGLAPKARILIFSMHAEPIYAARAMEAGARGYVSKSAPPDEILQAIDAVLAGGTYVEKEIAREMADKAAESGDYLKSLTRRDLEILRLLVAGHTLNEIADSLGIAYKTVANTCSRIREKMGARSTAELLSVSRRLGLV